MSDLSLPRRDPEVRQRNRRLVAIILAVALASATFGTLYLRHYGFHAPQNAEQKFH